MAHKIPVDNSYPLPALAGQSFRPKKVKVAYTILVLVVSPPIVSPYK